MPSSSKGQRRISQVSFWWMFPFFILKFQTRNSQSKAQIYVFVTIKMHLITATCLLINYDPTSTVTEFRLFECLKDHWYIFIARCENAFYLLNYGGFSPRWGTKALSFIHSIDLSIRKLIRLLRSRWTGLLCASHILRAYSDHPTLWPTLSLGEKLHGQISFKLTLSPPYSQCKLLLVSWYYK